MYTSDFHKPERKASCFSQQIHDLKINVNFQGMAHVFNPNLQNSQRWTNCLEKTVLGLERWLQLIRALITLPKNPAPTWLLT